MRSQWSELKPEAIKLRKRGLSIKKVEARLGIPRSTLSGWFRDIKLTTSQIAKLEHDRTHALLIARTRAVTWHNQQKQVRILAAHSAAEEIVRSIDINDSAILKLVAAALYLGEGKKEKSTSLGSSDPLILRFFIAILRKAYEVDAAKIICELHLRADQDEAEMKAFWMLALNLPASNFKATIKDRRTLGTVTYPHYKGVCNIRCGNVAIQRELLHLSRLYFAEVAK